MQLYFCTQHLWYTPLPWIVKTSKTTMFLWQLACSCAVTERERWTAGLRSDSPRLTFLNSPIFPLDTAKNHRLNSIVHRYYWQRLFMQLTAHYLSHSLLASILICERERGEWQRAERNEERKTDVEGERESWHSEWFDKGEIETNTERGRQGEERKR